MQFIKESFDPAVPLSELKQHPRNPNVGNKQELARAIDAVGFYGSLVVQRSTGFILAGNHRFGLALERDIQTLPVTWVEVDDATAEKILLADNRLTRLGEFDDQALAELLTSIQSDSQSFEGTGYDEEAYRSLMESVGEAILSANGIPPEANEKPTELAGVFVGDTSKLTGPERPTKGKCQACGRRFQKRRK